MTPCKFEMDATGNEVLIYSADRKTIFAKTDDPDFVSEIAVHLNLTPLTKTYAMADLTPSGKIRIGDALPEQSF